MTDIASAYARGIEGKSLLEFIRTTDPADMSALVTGQVLKSGENEPTIGGERYPVCDAYIVSLGNRDGRMCSVNLAALVAMALAYCQDQQKLARRLKNGAAATTGARKSEGRRRGRNKLHR